MANSNRKKARKLQDAKKAKAAEKTKAVKKAKTAEEKPIKYTVTAKQQADGTSVAAKADLISLSRRIKH